MNTFVKTVRVATASACVIVFTAMFGSPAFAGDDVPPAPGKQFVPVYVAAGVNDPSGSPVDPGAQTFGSCLAYDCQVNGYGEKEICPLDDMESSPSSVEFHQRAANTRRCDRLTTAFSSKKTITCEYYTCNIDISGSSQGYWRGLDPFYADDMTHADKWVQNGCSVSVSVPSGVGITGSGDTAEWYTDFGGQTWEMHHAYSGIRFTTPCRGTFYEYSTTTARFGSWYYMVDASW